MIIDAVVALFFILTGLTGILSRRAQARRYVRTMQMMRGPFRVKPAKQDHVELFSVILGIALIAIGIAFLVSPP